MKKRIVVLIVICFAMSIGIVLVLMAISSDMRRRPGSFLREFPPHPALEGNVLDLLYNSYYIAGGTPYHLYLANYTAPLQMLIVDRTLTDTQQVKLNVKGIMNEKFWAVRTKVDSPNYYVADGAVPIIYKGTVDNWQAERYPHDNVFFLDFVPISSGTFGIKSLGKPVRENILGKITNAVPHVQMKNGILQKQVDGIFCTDGMLQFDKELSRLVYLHYYRNEYVVLDTNLNLLSRRHTIDTTNTVRIKVATVASSGSRTLASPPRMVNKACSVSGNLLFVNSPQVAKNQNIKSVDHAAIIDVYDLRTGSYQFSFYIYDYQGRERLKQFSVFGDKLFALFDTHLQVWDLNPKFFPVFTR